MDRLLKLRAVCRYLSCSRADVRAWRESGQFPAPVVLPGGKERWRVSDLNDWIARCGLSLGGLRLAATTVPVVAQEEDAAVDLSALSELSREFLQALYEGGGEDGWMSGPSIAKGISDVVDHTSGSFKRSSAELRLHNPPLIETDRARGYRLTLAARGAIESGTTLAPRWPHAGTTGEDDETP